MEEVSGEHRIINILSENHRIAPAAECDLDHPRGWVWKLVAIAAIIHKTAATDHNGMVFTRRKA